MREAPWRGGKGNIVFHVDVEARESKERRCVKFVIKDST
jgi:hypothetical protein